MAKKASANHLIEHELEDDVLETDRQVGEKLNFSRQTVWRRVKDDPTFPRPIQLSPGCTRFSRNQRLTWMRNKMRASGALPDGER